jgi:hypothetical protein
MDSAVHHPDLFQLSTAQGIAFLFGCRISFEYDQGIRVGLGCLIERCHQVPADFANFYKPCGHLDALGLNRFPAMRFANTDVIQR